MCIPASMIVTRERVLWLRDSDSHEDVIRHYGLNDGVGRSDFARVEITPQNGNFALPLDQWTFSIDQDVLPDWWSAEWAEGEVRRELPRWIAARTITSDCVIEGGIYFVFEGSPVITQSGGVVRTWDSRDPVITRTTN